MAVCAPNSACGIRLPAQQMTGQQFYTQPENWRRVAHIIADAIYKQITGEEGYFDTRIVFVSETGPKTAAQAPAGDHGSGWLQRPHADQTAAISC